MHTLHQLLKQIEDRLTPNVKEVLRLRKKQYAHKLIIWIIISFLLGIVLSRDEFTFITNGILLALLVSFVITVLYAMAYSNVPTSHLPIHEVDDALNEEEIGILLDMQLSDISISVLQDIFSRGDSLCYYNIIDIIEQEENYKNIQTVCSDFKNINQYTSKMQQANIERICSIKEKIWRHD